MPSTEIGINIDRPVADVFAYAVDVERLPEWNLVIEAAWPTSGDQARVGATYMVRAKVAGRAMEIPSEVVAYEANGVYAYEARGSMPYVSTKIFSAAGAGTRVPERLQMERDGLMSRLMAPLLLQISKRSHKKNLEQLKRILETAGAAALA